MQPFSSEILLWNLAGSIPAYREPLPAFSSRNQNFRRQTLFLKTFPVVANRICQLTTLIVLRILWDNLAATGVHSRLNFSFFFFCQTTDVGDVSAEIVGWQETKSKWLGGWLELGDGKHSLFRIPDFWTGCLVLGKKLHSTKKFFIKASYDGLYDSANPVGQPRNAKFQWVFQWGFPSSTLAVYRVHHEYWKKTDNLGSDGIQSQTWNRYTKQGLSALAHLWDKKDLEKWSFFSLKLYRWQTKNFATEKEMTEQLLNWPRRWMSSLRLFSHCRVRTAQEFHSGSWNHWRNWSKTDWQPQRG